MESYTMTQKELEAAVHNWLAQSGSHVTNKFPELEPSEVEIVRACGSDWHDVVIYFDEPLPDEEE